MTREAGSTTTLLVGALLLRLAVTGAHRRYVRPGMGPWLIVAGLVLVLLGGAALVASLRRPVVADEHGHEHSERVGWVLLGPVVALLLIAPPALGSFAVDRTRIDVDPGGATFSALAASDVAVPMTLLEFSQRAVDRDGASFDGQPVTLTGFVLRDADGDGFRIARYQIACCAADAAAAVVRVVDTGGTSPPADHWVTVTGTFHASDEITPELRPTSVVEIAPPGDPYE